MRKIKVKPIFGAHQIYQEIANYPPEGVEYVGVSGETKKGTYYRSKKLKEKVNRWMQKLRIPRMILVRSGDYDLIHSSRGIIPIQVFGRKPWVMDIEQFTSFMGLHFDLMIKSRFLRGIVQNRLRSRNCKAILCHCEATRKSFLRYLDCRGFKSKLKVLYPSSHLISFRKKKHEGVRLLAVLSLFEQKGGLFVLEAFSRLEKKFPDIELWIKADVPEKIKKKFSSKKIKYFSYSKDIIPRERLIKEIYSKCDIFIYPTFCDSFGYSLIDGLVAGLPVVGTNLFAVPEVIEDGRNGFIVKIPGYNPKLAIQEHPMESITEKDRRKFVSDLTKSLEKLIKNKKLRKGMGSESLKFIKDGKFSIRERNKKLRKVYEEALK